VCDVRPVLDVTIQLVSSAQRVIDDSKDDEMVSVSAVVSVWPTDASSSVMTAMYLAASRRVSQRDGRRS